MADPSSTVSSALIGEIFVERGHITPAQLEEALATQAETGELLGEILVERYNVPRVELAGVLAEQWATMERSGGAMPANEPIAEAAAAAAAESPQQDTVDVTSDVDFERRPIGEIFVEQGVVTPSQLEAALATQSESGQRLGEVLVAQGVITRLELASALADQWSTLQKIRPPEPKPAEPWQEVAVRATPPADGSISAAPNREASAEVEGLRDAVKALEERLRLVSATSSAATGPAPDETLRELGATFESRLEELAQRFDETFTADIAAVREALEELRVKVGQPVDDDRIAALEQRLETAVDGLLARIEAATGNDADEAIDALRATLAGLEHRTAEAPTRDELDALRVAFAAVSDEVKELTEVPGGVTHDELEQHLARVVADLGARIDAIAANPGDAEALDDLRGQLSALAAQIAVLPRSPEPSGLAERVDGLAARVDELAQEVAASGGDSDALRGAIDAERDARNELARRLDHAVERLSAVDDLHGRIDALGDAPARLDATVGELDLRLSSIADTIAGLPSSERVAALEESLGSLPDAERVAALEAALGELPELRSRLEALVSTPTGVSSDDVAALATRLDDLAGRLDSFASVERVDELERSLETIRSVEDSQIDSLRTSVRELSEGLRELSGRQAGLGADQLEEAVTPLRARLEELAAIQSSAALRGPDDVTHAQLEELLGHERVARDELAGRLSELHGRLDELAGNAGVDEVARQGLVELRAQLDGIGTRIGEAAGHELGELKARVAQLEAVLHDDTLSSQVADLRSQLEPLTTSVEALAAAAESDAVAHQLTELRDQIAHLSSRVSDAELPTVDLQPLSHRVESLATDYGARIHSLEEARHRIDELDRRLAELPAPTADPTPELDAIRARLDELSSMPGGDEVARSGVAELRERIDSLAELAAELGHDQVARDDVAQLTARIAHLESAGSAKKAVSRLDDELDEHRTLVEGRFGEVWGKVVEVDELRNRIDRLDAVSAEIAGRGELEELRNRIDRLDAVSAEIAGRGEVEELRNRIDRLDSVSTETAGRGEVEDVRGRLDELAARFESVAPSDWVAGIERTATDAVAALQHRLDALEQRAAEGAESHEVAEARAALEALGHRVTQLSHTLEETQGSVVAIDGNVAATLQAAVKDMVSAATVAELAEQVHERLSAIEASAAPTRAALDELGMRLGAAEQNAWALPEELDGRFARLHQDLSARIEALSNGHAAALAAVHARLDDAVGVDEGRLAALEDAAGYASARLDGVEARLLEADGTVVERVNRLEVRFDAEAKRAEERGKETEKALRKGLAALAERLAANEEAYVESGKALRRSIERLGAAVIEADTRIAGMPLDAPDDGFVAFVPTGDGYRLRPLEGRVPAVGEMLDLGEDVGQLRVSRIATSPLPLDRRACAYLERV